MKSSKFRAIVKLDEKGEIECFCPYDEYLKGICTCREEYNCPEAYIEITVLPNSRPSDKVLGIIKNNKREVKKVERQIKKETDRIKQGINQIERASKNTRWRI